MFKVNNIDTRTTTRDVYFEQLIAKSGIRSKKIIILVLSTTTEEILMDVKKSAQEI